MSIKNSTPSLAPAPVTTLDDTMVHPPMKFTQTHTQLSTPDSSGIASLTHEQRDRYPTEGKVLEESEQVIEEPHTKRGPPTDVAASAFDERSRFVLFVGSDSSDFFSASRNSDSSPCERDLIGIADESTDVSPLPGPAGGLPPDASKLGRLQNSVHVGAIDERGSARPENLAIYVTQEPDTPVSLPVFTTQPFPSIPEVTGQDDSTDHSSEGVVNVYIKLGGGNGHVVEAEEAKIEHIEGVKDEAKPTPSRPTSFTSGMEEDSPAPEDQPHPAKWTKKRSETGSVSFISVRDFFSRWAFCFM